MKKYLTLIFSLLVTPIFAVESSSIEEAAAKYEKFASQKLCPNEYIAEKKSNNMDLKNAYESKVFIDSINGVGRFAVKNEYWPAHQFLDFKMGSNPSEALLWILKNKKEFNQIGLSRVFGECNSNKKYSEFVWFKFYCLYKSSSEPIILVPHKAPPTAPMWIPNYSIASRPCDNFFSGFPFHFFKDAARQGFDGRSFGGRPHLPDNLEMEDRNSSFSLLHEYDTTLLIRDSVESKRNAVIRDFIVWWLKNGDQQVKTLPSLSSDNEEIAKEMKALRKEMEEAPSPWLRERTEAEKKDYEASKKQVDEKWREELSKLKTEMGWKDAPKTKQTTSPGLK